MIKSAIEGQLITAMKNKDTKTISILRIIKSEIKNKEISLQRNITDDEVYGLIKKEIKKLEDALILFKKANRIDLITENEEQIKILKKFLPMELSDEELKQAINNIKSKNKEIYEKNPKTIIGICIKELGNKASPKRIIEMLNS